jgi:hypothetical protein
MYIFVREVVLEEQVLGFDEVGVGAEGFEVLFHVFHLYFAVEFLQNGLEVVQIKVFGVGLEQFDMVLEVE